jgi:hypothetical protein
MPNSGKELWTDDEHNRGHRCQVLTVLQAFRDSFGTPSQQLLEIPLVRAPRSLLVLQASGLEHYEVLVA